MTSGQNIKFERLLSASVKLCEAKHELKASKVHWRQIAPMINAIEEMRAEIHVIVSGLIRT